MTTKPSIVNPVSASKAAEYTKIKLRKTRCSGRGIAAFKKAGQYIQAGNHHQQASGNDRHSPLGEEFCEEVVFRNDKQR